MFDFINKETCIAFGAGVVTSLITSYGFKKIRGGKDKNKAKKEKESKKEKNSEKTK